MKLASLKDGRDGRLVVVSKDLTNCVEASGIASTMQQALDQWENISDELEDLYTRLKAGQVNDARAFNIADCASPLPRAYNIADGSAYLNHVELVRKARGAEMPPEFLEDPLMYQAASDTVLDPTENIEVASEEYGTDFEAEIAIVTDDVPAGVSVSEAGKHIKLVMLMNDVSLRNLIPSELAKGFGFFQSKPPSSFSPVAVTPDELEDSWQDFKLCLPLLSTLNDVEIGRPNAGEDMNFNFAELVAHAAKTRPLKAGSIIGSGTVSNNNPETGSSCLAEIRMIEIIEDGEAKTPFMKYGDIIRIEMTKDDSSIFGAIEQKVVRGK